MIEDVYAKFKSKVYQIMQGHHCVSSGIIILRVRTQLFTQAEASQNTI